MRYARAGRVGCKLRIVDAMLEDGTLRESHLRTMVVYTVGYPPTTYDVFL